jgi:hypothetical protein
MTMRPEKEISFLEAFFDLRTTFFAISASPL